MVTPTIANKQDPLPKKDETRAKPIGRSFIPLQMLFSQTIGNSRSVTSMTQQQRFLFELSYKLRYRISLELTRLVKCPQCGNMLTKPEKSLKNCFFTIDSYTCACCGHCFKDAKEEYAALDFHLEKM